MKYNPDLHHRRSIRLKGYDYTKGNVFFLTICTYQRECTFGEIQDSKMVLNDFGMLVQSCWEDIPNHFQNVVLDAYVVMPNHLHGIVSINDIGRGTACRAPTVERFSKPVSGSLATIVRSFKSAATKKVNAVRTSPGAKLWQRNYYERIVRDDDEWHKTREYIVNNPLKWDIDQENPANRVRITASVGARHAVPLQTIVNQIKTPDPEWRSRAQSHLDRLTKPPGSLGRLEELALWYIETTGKFPPSPVGARHAVPLQPQQTTPPRLYVFAADHGVTDEGVSAYPKAVTAQMVYNFLNGGAAVNVLARHAGAQVRVVDMGVDADFEKASDLIGRKIARGTQNMAKGPAMSRDEALAALACGTALAEEAVRDGVTLLATGEMGIGNTTAASAVTAVLCAASVETVTGRGTGIDESALKRKQEVIQRALDVNRPNIDDPLDVLRKVGGFEIGGMAGLILGAAAHRVPVVIDGFISTAAALIAVALKAEARAYLLAAHESAEPGHRIALQKLGLSPLLNFNMRLGEGTGAALAIGMVDAAIKIVNEMATFEQAGVSNKTEGE